MRVSTDSPLHRCGASARKRSHMMPWMFGGLAIVVIFTIWVIRDAILDDRERKAVKRKPRDY